MPKTKQTEEPVAEEPQPEPSEFEKQHAGIPEPTGETIDDRMAALQKDLVAMGARPKG
jgi:nucleotide-binding universal stress UspA family protein